jgi:N-acetyl-anhydromuramyl-L-alanine amidase AmpD
LPQEMTPQTPNLGYRLQLVERMQNEDHAALGTVKDTVAKHELEIHGVLTRPARRAPIWESSSLTRTTSIRSDALIRHVRNCSSRHGAKPVLIVLHDTEGLNVKGLADLRGLGDWFDNPSSQASSHVATDAEGNSARYVDDAVKAWSCVFFNSLSLNIEQVGFATQFGWPDAQIQETARWVARWAQIYGIPIRQGRVSLDGRIIKSGVVQHSDLGSLGGGHHDCGDHYPFDEVLRIANGYLHLLEPNRTYGTG